MVEVNSQFLWFGRLLLMVTSDRRPHRLGRFVWSCSIVAFILLQSLCLLDALFFLLQTSKESAPATAATGLTISHLDSSLNLRLFDMTGSKNVVVVVCVLDPIAVQYLGDLVFLNIRGKIWRADIAVLC